MSAAQVDDGRLLGKRMPRKEDARLLTGRGTFVDDVVLPGMLHVAFVRSPTCQSPHLVARYLSLALDQPELSVRIIAKDVGGAFGQKNHPWREEMSVIVGSMLLGRPLKWIEDRWENLVAANQAREQEVTVRVAMDRQGKLLATHCDYHLNNGAYPQGAEANVAVHMFMWAAYKMPQLGFFTRGWHTNTVGLGAYRGPWGMESLARETLLDIAARELGIDPIEIRRRNLLTKADQPCTTPMGLPLEDITPAECLDKLLEVIDVSAFRAEQAAVRKRGKYPGIGIAVYIEPTGAAGQLAPMTGELAHLRIEPTGKVTALLSTHSQGHGTQSTMAQVIADQLGVAYEDVTVFEGDSSRGGFGPGAAGSRQGVVGGGACRRAAALLKMKVKRIAAHILDSDPESITVENGLVTVTGSEGKTRTLRQIAEIAYGEPARLPPDMESGLEVQYRYDPPPVTFTSAAHACIVEVDADTGFVNIKRWLSCEDCGTIINPAVVEGQIAGGLTQAIGAVLLEEAGYDARGNPQAVTYKDYLLPAISDVPDFEYLHACTPSKSEGGFRGVGEGGAIIGPPTLVNAIADALAPFGEVPLDLPLTPTKILAVIEGRPLAGKTAESARDGASASNQPAASAKASEGSSSPTAAATHAKTSGALPSSGAVARTEGSEPLPSPPAAGPSVSPAAVPSAVIDGRWNMVLATPVGPQKIIGIFTTDHDVLKGVLESDQGSQSFEGTIAGNRLKWEMKVTKPMPITLKYDITVEANKLTGKVKMGIFGSANVTGEKA